MAIVSDSRDIDTAVADMLVTTVKMEASFVEVFIPLQAYRYFNG